MQFVDLNLQQKRIRHDLERRILAVLDHGKYIMGPDVAELEAALVSCTGARHCITCSSGTGTLLMQLMAWDIGPGDAVFVPPFTFFATGEMPAPLGAIPILLIFCLIPAICKAVISVPGRSIPYACLSPGASM